MRKIIKRIYLAFCICISLIIWYNNTFFSGLLLFLILLCIPGFISNTVHFGSGLLVLLTFALTSLAWEHFNFIVALIVFVIFGSLSIVLHGHEESSYNRKYARTPRSSYEDQMARNENYDPDDPDEYWRRL